MCSKVHVAHVQKVYYLALFNFFIHFLAEIAARTLRGDIGIEFNRTPTASYIAFAIAAGGGAITVFPQPLTPKGCSGLGLS